eukprot:NODE_735_length_4708_cov_0.180122.p3 type:complete len:220 gc:universal NODE_735_length_4708_cov_0.180122:4412-3753(-)
MQTYKQIADHYIKNPSIDSTLFNYDAYVLKNDKKILANHLLFQPDQLHLMDPHHPFLHVNTPKDIVQVPLAYWPTYIDNLEAFKLTDNEHSKNINFLLEHMKEHKHNALVYHSILKYVSVFSLQGKILKDSEYASILFKYTKYDFMCDESFITLLLMNSLISNEEKFTVIRRRAEKLELSTECLDFLVEQELMQHIRFYCVTDKYQSRIKSIMDKIEEQ